MSLGWVCNLCDSPAAECARNNQPVDIGTPMKSFVFALLLSSGLAALSSAAMAQTMMQACGPDIQRLCSHVGPGHIKQCMKKHKKDLSPVCIGTLVKMKQGMSQ
jgi:Cysteine rich repeat